ncbi:16S rRNA (cytosine(1402)-N(4))-methyltransferase [Ignatzschineria rhizosphaerae]|uniref:16S rRNA (Cytosine(1402)-N(4))-methyltransferase n=1 Tax=Ignatzschineria rhizosphaerae TaxID=2923279 RepID=A0ABY3X283_9GAMM|nr:class I SAM-dependent methyltransferase [Ignatzschineria rhizosphaerae]UNM96944.1 16S rRNA (cytosine(1402)-N(4))-methyltransferase [Ignatzschineria rhizosphaerae]
MRYQYLTSIHPLIDQYIDQFIQPHSIVIDATLGNGHDSYKIAQKMDHTGKLYGFDIQKMAIENSQQLLNTLPENAPKITLIEDSHSNFKTHIKEPVDFIIYNLGYLPKGDKEITTLAKSTLESVQAGLELLTDNGKMLIAVYHGHIAGQAEKIALEEYLQNLDQKAFHVFKQQFINQKNSPPFIYLIEKAKIRVE